MAKKPQFIPQEERSTDTAGAPQGNDSDDDQVSLQGDDSKDQDGAEPLSRDRVMAVVPTAFTLTTDDHVKHMYPAGRIPMLREHAEHPYSVAVGVVKAEE